MLAATLLLWPLLRSAVLADGLRRWGSVGIGAMAALWVVERLA